MQINIVSGRVLSDWAKMVIIVLIIIGILPAGSVSGLQSMEPCPQNMVDERTQDYVDYIQLQEGDRPSF